MRSHHRPKGTPEKRELADSYLDPDVWMEAETRRHEQSRWSEVMGQVMLLSRVLDDAMNIIFGPVSVYDWNQQLRSNAGTNREDWEQGRREIEVAWLRHSSGPLSCQEICDTLSELGWSRSVRGWPLDRDKLIYIAERGLELGLRLEVTPLTGGF